MILQYAYLISHPQDKISEYIKHQYTKCTVKHFRPKLDLSAGHQCPHNCHKVSNQGQEVVYVYIVITNRGHNLLKTDPT